MPQLQIVDTTPNQPEPSSMDNFFNRISQEYSQRREDSEVGRILSEYQQNRYDANALSDLKINLQKNNKISPSRRVELMKDLTEQEKHNIERSKVLNKQYDNVLKKERDEYEKIKREEDLEKERLETKALLQGAGYSDEEIQERGKFLSPASARSEIGREKEGDVYSKEREKALSKYVSESLDKLTLINQQVDAVNEAEQLIQGEITGPGVTAIAKNNPYGQLLLGLTPDEAALQAVTKRLLEGSKGIFGNQITEKEVFILLNQMFPSVGKSKEANAAGLGVIKKFVTLEQKRLNLINDITNGGKIFVPNLVNIVDNALKKEGEDLIKQARDVSGKFNKDKDSQQNKVINEKYKSMKRQDVLDENKRKGLVSIIDPKTGRPARIKYYEGIENDYELIKQ